MRKGRPELDGRQAAEMLWRSWKAAEQRCAKHLVAMLLLWLTVIFALIGIVPIIHKYWPSSIPLTGSFVILQENQIVRQNYKSQSAINLKNIVECHISNQSDPKGNYFLLSFKPKELHSVGNIPGDLTETATSDPAIRQEIAQHMSRHGIAVFETDETNAVDR